MATRDAEMGQTRISITKQQIPARKRKKQSHKRKKNSGQARWETLVTAWPPAPHPGFCSPQLLAAAAAGRWARLEALDDFRRRMTQVAKNLPERLKRSVNLLPCHVSANVRFQSVPPRTAHHAAIRNIAVRKTARVSSALRMQGSRRSPAKESPAPVGSTTSGPAVGAARTKWPRKFRIWRAGAIA